MTRPSLSACLIVKDEEENLANCLNSIKAHVDEIICVDTGSSDKTMEVARSCGAKVFEFTPKTHPDSFFLDTKEIAGEWGSPEPFCGEWCLADFGGARNESFRHATGDYLMWIDADDVLEGAENLPTVVADMHSRGLGLAFLPYNYAQDDKGRVYYRQWRERVFKKGTARWINPVHEVLVPFTANNTFARYELPVYSHRRKADRKTIPNRNYKILLRQAWQVVQKGEKPDPRMLFYLGQEAKFIEPVKALGFYSEYLKISGWNEERAAAHCAIGMLLEFGMLAQTGIKEEDAYMQAHREYATAAVEMPGNPDGIFGCARVAYLRKRYNECIDYTERGLKMANPESMLGANPMDRVYRPHVYYNHALSLVGRLEEAIRSCEEALKICPDDPGVPGGAPGMLIHNLKIYREELARRQRGEAQVSTQPVINFSKTEDLEAPPTANIPRDAMVIWAIQLWKQHRLTGDDTRALQFLDALPHAVQTDPVIDQMRKLSRREPVPKDDVVLFLGPGVEYWGPGTPNTQGLGGSETAAIEMGKNLVKLGRKVKIYAEAEGTVDGVEYVHHSKFRGANCAVFIASRTPWSVEVFGPVKADLKLLWVHDIHCGPPNPNMERWLYSFNRILCLSNWHKNYFLSVYPSVHPDQVIVTRNGIDPARFTTELPKTNRLVFASSPNRGLVELLLNMEKIRAEVPDAQLDIFYGFNTWETMAKSQNDTGQLQAIEGYKQLIGKAVSDGTAVYHGRVPQPVLAEAFLRAKIWPHFTKFTETYCISAIEAQAAGCVPVCSSVAALPETVKHGIFVDTDAEFVRACVDLLKNEDKRAPLARQARQHGLTNVSWEALAREWVSMFSRVSHEVSRNPIPLWRAA